MSKKFLIFIAILIGALLTASHALSLGFFTGMVGLSGPAFTMESRLIVSGFDKESFTVDPFPPLQGVPAICSYGSFVAAAHGRHLYFFDASKNTPEWTFDSTSTLANPFVSQDAALVLVEESENGDTYIFDRSSRKARRVFSGDTGIFEAISANGRRIAFLTAGEQSGDNRILVADTLSGDQIMVLQASPSGNTSFISVWDIDLSQDGNAVALAAQPWETGDKGIYLYENSSPEPTRIRALDNITELKSVSISPDGSAVAASYIIKEPPADGNGASNSSSVLELLGRTGASPLWKYSYTSADSLPPPYTLEFSQSGDLLLAWNSTTALLFDETGPAPLWSATFPGERVTDAAMAYDGDPIVVATAEDNVYLYNGSGELQWSVNEAGSRIALTTLGRRLAVSSNSTLTLFDINEPVPLWTFTYPYP